MATALANIIKVDNLFTKNFFMPKENIVIKEKSTFDFIKWYTLHKDDKLNYAYEV